MFLVRDWQCPDEYDYGVHGGERFLAKKLSTYGRHSDLTDVRQGIQDCFEHLDCCLLPYPGSKVATNRGLTRKLSDLEGEFKIEVKKFVESIASFDNLVKKKDNGQELTCGELVQFMEAYVEAFHGGDFPSATTLLNTTAKAHHETALNKAKTQFLEGIKKVCGEEVPYMDPNELDRKLEDVRSDAEKTFNDYPKEGSPSMNEKYLGTLSNFMMEKCAEYKQMNGKKAKIFMKILYWLLHRIMTFYSFVSSTFHFLKRMISGMCALLKSLLAHFAPIFYIVVKFSIISYLVSVWFGPSAFLYYIIIMIMALCLWIFLICTGSCPPLRRTMDAFIWIPLPPIVVSSLTHRSYFFLRTQPIERQMVGGHDERAQGGNKRTEHMD